MPPIVPTLQSDRAFTLEELGSTNPNLEMSDRQESRKRRAIIFLIMYDYLPLVSTNSVISSKARR
jgi:hypothetical protein